jgi:DNA polymerase-3 subunit beta
MIKTLTKHAKGRHTIPILGQVRVVNGVAQTTDMDFWISGPVALPDGMYHAEGFDKGIQIKSELPVTDFPEPKVEKTSTGRTTLEARHMEPLAWVLKAASKNAARYYLNGVYFDWCMDDAALVATDGHRLHSFVHVIEADRPKKKRKKQADGKYRMTVPSAGAILPSRAAKIILDLMKETKAAYVDLKFYGITFRARVGNAVVVEGKLIDGTFPDWRRVVPTCPAGNKTFYDPAQIKSLIPELQIRNRIALGSGKKPLLSISKGMARAVHGKREWPVTIQWDMQAGFNVAYLADLCGGVMEYIDPASPFKVTDRRGGIERMAVIMPLRV